MPSQADKIREKLKRGIETASKAFVLEINRQLRTRPPLGTPVQTGHARANWIPSVGTPHQGELDTAGGNAAAAQGQAQVMAYTLEQGPMYVSNRAPYIRRLNEGSSTQSPALFVESAIARAKAKVKAMLERSGLLLGPGSGAE